MQHQIHPVSNNQSARATTTTAAPACPSGCIEYEWDADLAEPVVCHLEYEPAERGSREYGTGLQLEPDYDEAVTLTAAYVRGLDISPMLSSTQVEHIESLALVSVHESRDDFDGYND